VAVKYSFDYNFNVPMLEKLQVDKFYDYSDADILRKSPRGYTYEETPFFFMHTIWIRDESEMGKTVQKETWKGDTLSRWFEWFMTVRTYTSLVPFGAQDAAEVIPVEIKGPICDKCIMTIKHSGNLVFMEERVVPADDAEWKSKPIVYRADKGLGCDWATERNGLVFESLAKNVCFKLELKDKTVDRVFVLTKLTYGYNGNTVDSKLLYDAEFKNK